MRCFEQKWPWQKLQSPTIRCAASLHSLKLQRGLRGAMMVVVVVVAMGGEEKDGRWFTGSPNLGRGEETESEGM